MRGEYSYSLNESQSVLIDFIRALSAQGVVIGHLFFWQGFLFSKTEYPGLYPLASYCVLIFFILSGFLICLSVTNKEKYNFNFFLLDRFVRIYTAYIPALVLVFTLDYLNYKINHQPFYMGLYIKEFFGNLLMLQEFPLFECLQKLTHNSIFYMPYIGTDLPLWTLSIEWWLYMMFGWIVLAKHSNKFVWFAVLVMFSIVPLYQLFIGSHMGAGISIYWFLSTLFPVLLAAFKKQSFNFRPLAVMLLLIGGYGYSYNYFVGIFIFMLGFFLMLKCYETSDMRIPDFFKKGIKFFADFSFSLYLIHYTFITTLISLFPGMRTLPVGLRFLSLFLLANVGAYVFAYFTEFRYKQVKYYLKNKLVR